MLQPVQRASLGERASVSMPEHIHLYHRAAQWQEKVTGEFMAV